MPWLATISRNVCLNIIRLQSRKPPLPEPSPQPKDELENIRQVIATLDEPHKSILIYKFSGMDNDECSRLLNIKRSHFKVYLFRAMQLLRERVFLGE